MPSNWRARARASARAARAHSFDEESSSEHQQCRRGGRSRRLARSESPMTDSDRQRRSAASRAYKTVNARYCTRSGQVRSGFSPVTSGPSMGTRALAKLGTRTIRPHGYRHTRYCTRKGIDGADFFPSTSSKQRPFTSGMPRHAGERAAELLPLGSRRRRRRPSARRRRDGCRCESPLKYAHASSQYAHARFGYVSPRHPQGRQRR